MVVNNIIINNICLFVKERCNNSEWSKWNSNKLKRKISSPLQIKHSCWEGENYNIQTEQEKRVLIDNGKAVVEQGECSKNHEVRTRSKQMKSNTSNKVRETCSNRLARFAELAECKIELVHSMLKAGQEKHELEMAIKRKQLEKEQLEIELLQKELEIKNNTFKRQKKRNESENIN